MRCHICNTELTEEEIQWSPSHCDWEPCRSCNYVIDSLFTKVSLEMNEEVSEDDLDAVIAALGKPEDDE